MKKLKVIFSLVMIAVLLFSSVGFSVNRHYCMGMLMEESFYSLSKSCGMEAEETCERPGQSIDMGCCDVENLAFAGIDVISLSKKNQNIIPLNTSDGLVVPLAIQPQTTYSPQLSFFPPPEPLPYGRDLLVQVQRFLI